MDNNKLIPSIINRLGVAEKELDILSSSPSGFDPSTYNMRQKK